MKHSNGKKWIKRAASLLLGGAMLLPMLCTGAEAVDSGDVTANVVNGQVAIVKWVPIISASDFPEGDNYITVLTNKGWTIHGDDILIDGPDDGQLVTSGNYTPYSYSGNGRKSTDIFYTVGTMGAPMFRRQGWDGDNKGYEHSIFLAQDEYPYCPTVGLKRDDDELDNESWVSASKIEDGIKKYCGDKNAFNLAQYNSPVAYWTVANYEKNSSNYPGKFCIFKNWSNSRDPGWQNYDNGNIWCDQEGDWEDLAAFNMWAGKPTMYSTLTQSYTVSDGQTLNLNAEEGFSGVYVPKNVTLTVNKGGTLSVNETMFNDGTIINNGGTVIIQSKGRISPMASDGLNKIVVMNGGALIIMEGGALYTPEDTPMILAQSRLINFGTYVMGGNLYLYSSFVENRKGGTIMADLNFAPAVYGNFGGATISGGEVSGMSATTESKIYLYDTKEHYGAYGCMNNDGNLLNFNMTSDVYWFNRSKADLGNLIDGVVEAYGQGT